MVYKMVNRNSYRTRTAQTGFALTQQGATLATIGSGLQDSPMAMKQRHQQDIPPQISGYAYNPNPSNTGGATPYPLEDDTSVNLHPNPEYDQAPQVVTLGDKQPLVT